MLRTFSSKRTRRCCALQKRNLIGQHAGLGISAYPIRRCFRNIVCYSVPPMKMAKKQTSLSDLFSPKKKIRIESPASDLDSPSTSACISSTTSAALLNNATESPSPSALSSSPASAALLKPKDATTASKRQQQKHDYESRRERGVVSGWLSEFPWLGVAEDCGITTIYCTVTTE